MFQGLGHVSWVKANLVMVSSFPRLARRRSWERSHFRIVKWDQTIRHPTLDLTQVRDCFHDLPFTVAGSVMPWSTLRFILQIHAPISFHYSMPLYFLCSITVLRTMLTLVRYSGTLGDLKVKKLPVLIITKLCET